MHKRLQGLAVALAGATALGVAGCAAEAGADGEGPSGDAVSVVATATVLGDVTGQVVTCGGGEVRTLMPVGTDPHDYSPASSDVTAMVRADLVVANGLGLEEGLASALAAAAQDGARVLEIAPAVDPLPFGQEFADDAGSMDPHVWLDASRMAAAAALIGQELAEITGDDAYLTCGNEAASELQETDGEVRAILAAVPQDSRVLVTDHDAFGYFAQAYDFEIAGVVVPGGSTLGAPSSEELADLVEVINDTGVRAIFADTANPTALIDAVAQETGRQIEVVQVYVGSLGAPGSGAETYRDMMLTNARLIADALSG